MDDAARIAVVGSGYVGTVVASCFAWLGHDAVGVEVDRMKLEVLNGGHVPFYEPGLEELVAAGLESCHLRFTDDYAEALSRVDAVFLCVGTPRGRDGSPDMRAIEGAGRAVGMALKEPAIVVTKSTIPVGGAFHVRAIIEETLIRNGCAPAVPLVHNPEFLREGSAIRDFLHPDRVILGSDETAPLETISRVYQPILDQSFPGGELNRIPGFLATDIVTAETVKYASNAFLATKISFINEIACICDLVGANINDVAAGMGFDRRIAPEFLKAGIGWGGSCFGKDLSALIAMARTYGHDPHLLSATMLVNERQRGAAIQHLGIALGSLRDRRIGLLGLAFKPGTDDIRDAPALDLAVRLHNLGASVVGYDPVVSSTPRPELTIVADPHTVAAGADAIVLATEWPSFALLNLRDLRRRMRGDVLLDGRSFFNRADAEAAGFRYLAMGQSSHWFSQHFRQIAEEEVDVGPSGSAAGNGQVSSRPTPTNTRIPLSSSG
jgi:UDPglucose 6-dehydrogenase